MKTLQESLGLTECQVKIIAAHCQKTIKTAMTAEQFFEQTFNWKLSRKDKIIIAKASLATQLLMHPRLYEAIKKDEIESILSGEALND